MKPTVVLIQEHDNIKIMLNVLENVASRLEKGERIDPEDLKKMVSFIRLYADKGHHAKEEDLLFPMMEKAGIPKEGGPIGVMLSEHTTGREYVSGMSSGIAAYEGGEAGAADVIIRNARGYIDLLSNHIEKEDNILYPMADDRLSEQQQLELSREFERVDGRRTGVEDPGIFTKMVSDFKKKYAD